MLVPVQVRMPNSKAFTRTAVIGLLAGAVTFVVVAADVCSISYADYMRSFQGYCDNSGLMDVVRSPCTASEYFAAFTRNAGPPGMIALALLWAVPCAYACALAVCLGSVMQLTHTASLTSALRLLLPAFAIGPIAYFVAQVLVFDVLVTANLREPTIVQTSFFLWLLSRTILPFVAATLSWTIVLRATFTRYGSRLRWRASVDSTHAARIEVAGETSK